MPTSLLRGVAPKIMLTGFGSLVLRIAGLGSTFLLGVVLARSLGPAEYGLYGLVTTIAALGMTSALIGTHHLAVREFSVLSAAGNWQTIRKLMRSFGIATSMASMFVVTFLACLAYLFLDRTGSAHQPDCTRDGASSADGDYRLDRG